MVVEGWKLPSGPDREAPGYVAGRHTLATVGGVIFDEPYHKVKFPFVFMNYSDPYLGFFGQSLATQLFGTQLTLNRILYTITQAITRMCGALQPAPLTARYGFATETAYG
jgi:hypothetical protein